MQLTPHLTDASLASVLDRDGSTAIESAQAHLMECESCRRDLEKARDDEAEVGRLFGLLDHSPPEIDSTEFFRTIATRRNTRKSGVSRSRLWPRNVARWTVAAGILTASVAAAALVPNSPVWRLIRMVAAASPNGHRLSSTTSSINAVTQPTSPRGVEIIPHGRVEILFRSSQAAGVVRVSTATTPQLSVEGEDDGPTYTVGQNTIIVNNRPSDSTNYIVQVPEITDVDTVYIHIAGRVAYSNIGNRVSGCGRVRRYMNALFVSCNPVVR